MKKITYITALACAALLLGGCDNWLDVNPRSQIKASALYDSEDGFRSSLNGVYVAMAQPDLYGFDASASVPETFARNWTIPVQEENFMNRLANFDFTYSVVESEMETLWLSYYNAIAQLNDLLANLEGSDVEFSEINRALLEGEALGLRAYLHFDLLRLFGPIPQGANMAAKAIPYVTEMSTDPRKALTLTYGKVLEMIEKDLDSAERILAPIDPIVFYSNNELRSATSSTPIAALANGNTDTPDIWLIQRQGRFNYYACLGTKARFCQWTGDTGRATSYAKKVIEAVNTDGTPKFELATESSYTSGEWANLTMFCEQVFGLQLPLSSQELLEANFTLSGTRFSQTPANIAVCYEATMNPEDIRNKPGRYWEEKREEMYAATNYFKKYVGSGSIKPNNRMPLLRLAEMYLIVIENLPVGEALPYFRTLRIARSMGIAVENSFASAGEQQKMERVEKEYRKDFFGEGQMFFFYKRLNYRVYSWPTYFELPETAYVIPLPKSQLAFENF